ncbi:MAG: hypothetical protein ACPG39_00725, partial [Flavobacteriaceae bacterium]
MILDAPYWEGRYASKNTGWDIGDISTPIKEFVDGLSDKSLQVLIPGAGNGHEAIYMREKGFDKVTVLDWSASALNNLKSARPDFPEDHLIKDDFFEHLGQYDLILEQTFFCAIDPKLREKYQKLKRICSACALGADLLLPDTDLTTDCAMDT